MRLFWLQLPGPSLSLLPSEVVLLRLRGKLLTAVRAGLHYGGVGMALVTSHSSLSGRARN